MGPNFQGLVVLDSFLASINLKELGDNALNPSLSSPPTNQCFTPNENKLSCKICFITNFTTLDEFKLHRQSLEHLNSLTKSLNVSNETDSEENETDSESIGSPFFEIVYYSTKLRCYKAILSKRSDDNYLKSRISLDFQIYNHLKEFKNSYNALLLYGGGYFAAAIIDNSTKEIVCSKTYRRYTTRRKQGGSQSIKDNQKSGIHSAGSFLRRENEKKLENEISNLVEAWKHHLDKCKYIFSNRSTFLLQDVFKEFEAKLRTFPFTTYQASFDEICRCYSELISTIKILE